MPKIDLAPGTARDGEPPFFSAQIARADRFYFDLNPPPRVPLAVVCGGREVTAADYRVDRPTFGYHAIEFVADGRGTVAIAGRTHRLQAGSAFVYGPRGGHTIESDPRRPLVKYFVTFTGARADRLLRECGLPVGAHAHTFAPEAIVELMDDLIASAARHTPRGPAICAVILEHLLLRLAETAGPPDVDQGRSFLTYQRCKRFIDGHHRDVHDLATVAAACGVDVSYLCRLFQRYHKQGPYHYLTRLKMTVAADLLQLPGRLVKEVAVELGFDDPFRFSRAFKQVYGISPKHFQDRRGR